MATEDEIAFSKWWAGYLAGLTHEDMLAGFAGSAVLRAAVWAWKASALLCAHRAESED
jgi:hypothetical protein